MLERFCSWRGEFNESTRTYENCGNVAHFKVDEYWYCAEHYDYCVEAQERIRREKRESANYA